VGVAGEGWREAGHARALKLELDKSASKKEAVNRLAFSKLAERTTLCRCTGAAEE
jgi:hypothetical protein